MLGQLQHEQRQGREVASGVVQDLGHLLHVQEEGVADQLGPEEPGTVADHELAAVGRDVGECGPAFLDARAQGAVCDSADDGDAVGMVG
ncbi:hypothetical protein ACFRQM_26790 [Streptomyces sp. NPDC056831]|uniref:hypothetical protein n=1 Tax=Streptomyces sp. NPDC056831 TaxID=3345954 RepID=UPI00369065EE